jgi:phosphotransferase system  glucose/maltose/N-acetylglucosamine-specific IIC component
MASIIRLISLISRVFFFFVIPAIPGAVLWWFLKPDMFWEKFAWVVTSMLFFVIIFFFIISLISDWIYKEEGEEETMDENEE